MQKPQNKAIQEFLQDGLIVDDEKYNILISVRDIIFSLRPETKEKIMYGGIVFSLENEMYSGVFVNKKHVSLEFSKGYLMDDPNRHLEGKGKYRRHLKLFKIEDISLKETAFYINQAV